MGLTQIGVPPRRLLITAVLDFSRALFVGSLVALPFVAALAELQHSERFTFYSTPSDHAALESWYHQQPGVRAVELVEESDGISVRFRARGAMGDPGVPPFVDLGYRVKSASSVSKFNPWSVREPRLLLIMILAAQAGFLYIGLRRRRDMRSDAAARPNAPSGKTGPALRLGLAIAAVLFVYGLAYEEALVRWLPSWTDEGPWSGLRETPVGVRTGVLAGGILLAPICEEIFFRGVLFARLAGAGYVRAAYLVSAVLFAAAHLDLWRFPAFVVYGLVLAWAYRRSGSLLAPITAHAVHNAAAFALLLAAD